MNINLFRDEHKVDLVSERHPLAEEREVLPSEGVLCNIQFERLIIVLQLVQKCNVQVRAVSNLS